MKTERDAMGREFEMTDEEEVEDEISGGGGGGERVRFIPASSPSSSAPSSLVNAQPSSSVPPPRKARLPRSHATLLRALEGQESTPADDGSLATSLIPKMGSTGSSGANNNSSSSSSNNNNSGGNAYSQRKIGDEIINI